MNCDPAGHRAVLRSWRFGGRRGPVRRGAGWRNIARRLGFADYRCARNSGSCVACGPCSPQGLGRRRSKPLILGSGGDIRVGKRPVSQGCDQHKPAQAELGWKPRTGSEIGVFGTTAVGFDPSMKEWVGHNDCELSVYWKIWVGMMLILILTSSTPYPILLRSVIFF